jgi:hypothetical protein
VGAATVALRAEEEEEEVEEVVAAGDQARTAVVIWAHEPCCRRVSWEPASPCPPTILSVNPAR